MLENPKSSSVKAQTILRKPTPSMLALPFSMVFTMAILSVIDFLRAGVVCDKPLLAFNMRCKAALSSNTARAIGCFRVSARGCGFVPRLSRPARPGNERLPLLLKNNQDVSSGIGAADSPLSVQSSISLKLLRHTHEGALLAWHERYSLRQRSDPEIEDGRDVTIKVTSCAVCGPDLHLMDGLMPTMKSGDILDTRSRRSDRDRLGSWQVQEGVIGSLFPSYQSWRVSPVQSALIRFASAPTGTRPWR